MAYVNGTSRTTIISSILHGWELPVAGCRQYCDENSLQYPSESFISSRVDESRTSIIAQYDALVQRLGRAFAYGDVAFAQDLERVETNELYKLKNAIGEQLKVKLSESPHFDNSYLVPPLPPRPSSSASTRAAPEPKDWENKTEKYVQAALDKTVQALHDLATRQGYFNLQGRDPLAPMALPGDDVSFCKGAVLLQKSKADWRTVLQRRSSDYHYCCTHCYLEISDFQSTALNYTAEDWATIASCHVLAYPSLKDRRAAYRCYACFARNYLNDVLPSAAAIRAHVDGCERMKAWKAAQVPSVQVPQQTQRRMPPSPNIGAYSQPHTPAHSRSQSRTPNAGQDQRPQTPDLGTHEQPRRDMSGAASPTGAAPQRPPPMPPRYETAPSGNPDGHASQQPPQYYPNPSLFVPGSFPDHTRSTSQPAQDRRGQQTPVGETNRAQTPTSNPSGPPPSSSQATYDETAIQWVVGAVGRTRAQAIDLLRLEDGNIELAIDRGLRENDEGLAPPKPPKPPRGERRRNPY